MSTAFTVPVLRLAHGHDLALPDYATPGSAGLDLIAAVTEDITIAPGTRAAIPTGISLALPDGYEGQVRPRSGLALEHGITVLNSPGTVDSDYRGEIRVILINLGQAPFTVTRGMRIAQLVVAPIAHAVPHEVEHLPETARGAGGFGSSGLGGSGHETD